MKKAEPVVYVCGYCGEDFTRPRRKYEPTYCSRSCSWKNFHEDWPSYHREISEERGYRIRDDDGEGE